MLLLLIIVIFGMLDLVIHLHRCCRRCYRVVIMFFINPELFFDYDWQPLFSDGFLQDTINLSEFLTYIALVGILNSIQQSKAIKKGNQV
ncbi:hypothetical protein Scep_002161 [Stephania cephalantha]|uniref:Uncharacterized protein n=1 Tax=Stephania cephalantha TaxID=152367 RepID=A0AAP0LAH5_9MAGN